jgi:hypothetical protein
MTVFATRTRTYEDKKLPEPLCAQEQCLRHDNEAHTPEI